MGSMEPVKDVAVIPGGSHRLQTRRRTGAGIVGQRRGHGELRKAGRLVGVVKVLVGDEEEQLVLQHRPADRGPGSPAMQRRIDQRLRKRAHSLLSKLVLLVEEEGRGVQSVIGKGSINLAMPVIGAGFGVDVDLRARGGSLLGVVHRGVDAQFLKKLRRRRRQAVADGAVDRGSHGRCAADRPGAGRRGARGAAAADVEVVALRGQAAGGHAVEEVGRVHAVHLEGVGGSALAVGPDVLVAQAAVGVDAAEQFCVHARRKHGQLGEAAGGQGRELQFVAASIV